MTTSRTKSETGTTSPNRREAIGTIAALGAAGAVAVPHLSHAGQTAASRMPKMLQLSCDEWNEFRGQEFQLFDREQGTRGTLRLEQVKDQRREHDLRPAYVRQDPLSLVFSASRSFADATYQVRHPKLGSANLFVNATRSGPLAENVVYQVVMG